MQLDTNMDETAKYWGISICESVNISGSGQITWMFSDGGWRRGVVVTELVVSTKLLCVEPVSTGMGDVSGLTRGGGTLFGYVTNHPGRLSPSTFRGRQTE